MPGRYCLPRHSIPFKSRNEGDTYIRWRGGQWAWQVLLTTSQDTIQLKKRALKTSRMTWRAMGLADIVRPAMGRHSKQETRVQNTWDDVAGNMRPAVRVGRVPQDGLGGPVQVVSFKTRVETAPGFSA